MSKTNFLETFIACTLVIAPVSIVLADKIDRKVEVLPSVEVMYPMSERDSAWANYVGTQMIIDTLDSDRDHTGSTEAAAIMIECREGKETMSCEDQIRKSLNILDMEDPR